MIDMQWVDWLGYIASVIVLISLTMSSIVRLRWISLVGSSLFATYGLFIHSVPVAFMNMGIAFINAFYLWKYYTYKEPLSIVETRLDVPLMEYFIHENKEDIERFVSIDELKGCSAGFFLLRDNNLAGIMAGDHIGDRLKLKLDYVTPKYRDFKLGTQLSE